nr:tetratricopeptide repeat protein [candidate division Zixibacteria bacterium]
MRRKVIAILLLMTALQLSCTDSDKAALRQYEKGMSRMNQGDPDKALEIFQSILRDYPETPYAYQGLAYYYEREGFLYEAIRENFKALAEHPRFLPSLLMSTDLSLRVKRPELAFFNIALYEENGGDLNLGRSIEAEALLQAGKLNDAESILRKALAENPRAPRLLIKQSEYLARNDQIPEGIEQCSRVVSTDTLAAAILLEAGIFYDSIGLYDSAALCYQRAEKLGAGDEYFLLDVAEAYIGLNYLHRAKKILDRFAEKAPNSHRLHLLRAEILEARGDYDNAVQEYGMILPQNNENPTVLSRFAGFKRKAGDGLGSEQYFSTAAQIGSRGGYPNTASMDLNYKLLDFYFQYGRFILAGPTTDGLLDSMPNDFRVLYEGAYLYLMVDGIDRLRELLPRALKAARGNPSYMEQMGSLYLKMDSLVTAHQLFQEVLGVDKLNTVAILGEMAIARKKSGPAAALKYLNGFDEYVSYRPALAEEKLKLYEALGENVAAYEFSRRLIEVAFEDLDRYRTALNLAVKSGRGTDIEEIYSLLLKHNADDSYALAMAGKHYLGSGDLDRAEELIRLGVALDTLNTEARIQMARLMEAQGQPDSAIAVYEDILKFDTYAGKAYGNLAVLLLEKGENPNRVANLANRALLYDKTNGRHFCTVGRAYLELKKYKIAKVKFDEALKLAPDDPEINFYAGINHQRLGSAFEARTYLKKALRGGLKGSLKKEAEAALNNL